jgi:glutamate-1-semialdehyde 2,1-aminomutase
MTSPASPLRPEDRDFYERELASFLPDRVFDAHTHLWQAAHVSWKVEGCTGDVGYDEYLRLVDDLHPGRRVAALFIPFANQPGLLPAANAWVARNLRPDCRGLFFVKPDDDPEWVRQEVRRLGLHGLKCYHTMAPAQPTWEAEIPAYLPEPLVALAHQEGWAITLHMVKAKSTADPQNIHWIRHYCRRYPDMKLILAHSARAFQPAHGLTGLPQLQDLPNLYCDTSANCEPIAHQAALRYLGPRRLLYGSDLPVCHMRGRSLGAADSFLWLYEDTPVWGEKHLAIKPVLVGLEHLRSLKWACWSERLSDPQVEDLFWNNAANLFGVS